MAIFEGFSPPPDAARAKQEALKLTAANGSLLTNSGLTVTGTSTSWQKANVFMPRIEKVANGYTVTVDNETFIAENVEAVTGIISAQLLRLGAK